MTRRQLRSVAPDELPGPRIDADSATVLAEATELLARLRTPYWLGDTGTRLHALASLIAEAQHQLPAAIRDARDQDLGWDEIAQLLNISPSTARRRAHP